ncbi:hypothetical protein GIB67_008702 [Kingdonia uniflora]|uniref:NPH3 domain-containing protein n=1 Tax=Kingdonia uniflora TaxID=39325 RepID=A0A7J7NGX1_9MAGN|nr:hypothetical protein GIB67_008702 [Kingdonia uniflora]
MQLEEAWVNDLLIPSLSNSKETLYDVDIVMKILEHFMMQGQSPPTSPPRIKRGLERRRSRSAENIDFEFQESKRSSSASHSSKLRVAKLVDGYLQEIARDVSLPLAKLIALVEAIPDFARIEHDDLYKAIDIFLKFMTWFPFPLVEEILVDNMPSECGNSHCKLLQIRILKSIYNSQEGRLDEFQDWKTRNKDKSSFDVGDIRIRSRNVRPREDQVYRPFGLFSLFILGSFSVGSANEDISSRFIVSSLFFSIQYNDKDVLIRDNKQGFLDNEKYLKLVDWLGQNVDRYCNDNDDVLELVFFNSHVSFRATPRVPHYLGF